MRNSAAAQRNQPPRRGEASASAASANVATAWISRKSAAVVSSGLCATWAPIAARPTPQAPASPASAAAAKARFRVRGRGHGGLKAPLDHDRSFDARKSAHFLDPQLEQDAQQPEAVANSATFLILLYGKASLTTSGRKSKRATEPAINRRVGGAAFSGWLAARESGAHIRSRAR